MPIEHLGLVDTDFQLSHDVEQGFDYARLLPQLRIPTGLSSVFYSSRNTRTHVHTYTRNDVHEARLIVANSIFLIGIYTRDADPLQRIAVHDLYLCQMFIPLIPAYLVRYVCQILRFFQFLTK